MRITINQNDGIVVVDGVGREVDTRGLPAEIRIVHFDTERSAGVIEFDALVPTQVRDIQAEDAAWAVARAAKVQEREINVPVMYKEVLVARAPQPINDFTPYEALLDAWTAAEPPAPTGAQLEAAELNKKRAAALKALEDKQLAESLLDPAAPAEVRAYGQAQAVAGPKDLKEA